MENSILIIVTAILVLASVFFESPVLGLAAGIAAVFTASVAARNIDKESDR